MADEVTDFNYPTWKSIKEEPWYPQMGEGFGNNLKRNYDLQRQRHEIAQRWVTGAVKFGRDNIEGFSARDFVKDSKILIPELDSSQFRPSGQAQSRNFRFQYTTLLKELPLPQDAGRESIAAAWFSQLNEIIFAREGVPQEPMTPADRNLVLDMEQRFLEIRQKQRQGEKITALDREIIEERNRTRGLMLGGHDALRRQIDDGSARNIEQGFRDAEENNVFANVFTLGVDIERGDLPRPVLELMDWLGESMADGPVSGGLLNIANTLGSGASEAGAALNDAGNGIAQFFGMPESEVGKFISLSMQVNAEELWKHADIEKRRQTFIGETIIDLERGLGSLAVDLPIISTIGLAAFMGSMGLGQTQFHTMNREQALEQGIIGGAMGLAFEKAFGVLGRLRIGKGKTGRIMEFFTRRGIGGAGFVAAEVPQALVTEVLKDGLGGYRNLPTVLNGREAHERWADFLLGAILTGRKGRARDSLSSEDLKALDSFRDEFKKSGGPDLEGYMLEGLSTLSKIKGAPPTLEEALAVWIKMHLNKGVQGEGLTSEREIQIAKALQMMAEETGTFAMHSRGILMIQNNTDIVRTVFKSEIKRLEAELLEKGLSQTRIDRELAEQRKADSQQVENTLEQPGGFDSVVSLTHSKGDTLTPPREGDSGPQAESNVIVSNGRAIPNTDYVKAMQQRINNLTSIAPEMTRADLRIAKAKDPMGVVFLELEGSIRRPEAGEPGSELVVQSAANGGRGLPENFWFDPGKSNKVPLTFDEAMVRATELWPERFPPDMAAEAFVQIIQESTVTNIDANIKARLGEFRATNLEVGHAILFPGEIRRHIVVGLTKDGKRILANDDVLILAKGDRIAAGATVGKAAIDELALAQSRHNDFINKNATDEFKSPPLIELEPEDRFKPPVRFSAPVVRDVVGEGIKVIEGMLQGDNIGGRETKFLLDAQEVMKALSKRLEGEKPRAQDIADLMNSIKYKSGIEGIEINYPRIKDIPRKSREFELTEEELGKLGELVGGANAALERMTEMLAGQDRERSPLLRQADTREPLEIRIIREREGQREPEELPEAEAVERSVEELRADALLSRRQQVFDSFTEEQRNQLRQAFIPKNEIRPWELDRARLEEIKGSLETGVDDLNRLVFGRKNPSAKRIEEIQRTGTDFEKAAALRTNLPIGWGPEDFIDVFTGVKRIKTSSPKRFADTISRHVKELAGRDLLKPENLTLEEQKALTIINLAKDIAQSKGLDLGKIADATLKVTKGDAREVITELLGEPVEPRAPKVAEPEVEAERVEPAEPGAEPPVERVVEPAEPPAEPGVEPPAGEPIRRGEVPREAEESKRAEKPEQTQKLELLERAANLGALKDIPNELFDNVKELRRFVNEAEERAGLNDADAQFARFIENPIIHLQKENSPGRLEELKKIVEAKADEAAKAELTEEIDAKIELMKRLDNSIERGEIPEEQAEWIRQSKAAEWVLDPPESKTGRKLIKKMEKDLGKKEPQVGDRSIVEFVNNLVDVYMILGPGQTTAKHPAHFLEGPNIIRSRSSIWQFNYHEAGHAMSGLIRERHPDFMKAMEDKLVALTQMAGSLASAKTAEEGFAELIRRYITLQETVPRELRDPFEVFMKKNYDDVFTGIRDAHRAYTIQRSRPWNEQTRSSKNDKGKKISAGDYINDLWYRVLANTVGGSPVLQKVRRKLWHEQGGRKAKSITATILSKEARQQAELLRNFEAEIKDTPSDQEQAWQNVINVPNETIGVLYGRKGELQGLRVRSPGEFFGDNEIFRANSIKILEEFGFDVEPLKDPTRFGNWVYLTKKSFVEIQQTIGADKWELFEEYGQFRAALERWNKKGHEYPFLRDGLSPPVLEKRLSQTLKENPKFEASFKEVNDYFDGLLLSSVISGAFTAIEAARIKSAFEDYWPLPKQVEDRGVRTFGGGAEPDFGIRRAFGGSMPFKNLHEAVEIRTKMAMDAYYSNRMMISTLKFMDSVAKNPNFTRHAKAEILRLAVPLKLETKLAEIVKDVEQREIISDFMNKQTLAKRMGVDLDAVERISNDKVRDTLDKFGEQIIKADDILMSLPGKDLWRSSAPNGVHIIAPFINGKRRYFQVLDAQMWQLFSHSKRPNEYMDLFFNQFLAKTIEPWKRAITQSWKFTIPNFMSRDPGTAALASRDKKAVIFGFFAGVGGVNRLLGRGIPEGVSEGELFSRSLNDLSTVNHRNAVDNFKAMLKNGIVVPRWTEMSMLEKTANAPAVVSSTLLKEVDILNWITGGKWAAQFSEEIPREGAYIEALRDGYSMERAQVDYNTITGNFGQRGLDPNVAAVIRSAGFLNPGLQIMWTSFERMSSPDPKQRLFWWGAKLPSLMVWGSVGAAINFTLTDEDSREWLRERSDEDRSRSLNLYGKIRLPFDYGIGGAAMSTGWNMTEGALLDDPVNADVLSREVIARAMDFPGPTELFNPYFKTMIELETGYSFYRSEDVVPAFLKANYPDNPELQTFPDVPQIYNDIGKGLEVSPLKVKYGVEQIMTYNFDDMLRVYGAAVGDAPIEELPDLPVIGRLFLREPRGFRAQSVKTLQKLDAEWVALRRQLEQIQKLKSQGDPTMKEISDEKIAELEQEMVRLAPFHAGMKQVLRIWTAVKTERKNPEPDREKMKELERKMVTAAQEILGPLLEETEINP